MNLMAAKPFIGFHFVKPSIRDMRIGIIMNMVVPIRLGIRKR